MPLTPAQYEAITEAIDQYITNTNPAEIIEGAEFTNAELLCAIYEVRDTINDLDEIVDGFVR